MTPKEKAIAIKIFEKFKYIRLSEGKSMLTDKVAKKCAIFHIDGILYEGATQYGIHAVDYGREKFWNKVKKEIEKL